MPEMGQPLLIYAFVARGKVVLVDHVDFRGSFSVVSDLVATAAQQLPYPGLGRTHAGSRNARKNKASCRICPHQELRLVRTRGGLASYPTHGLVAHPSPGQATRTASLSSLLHGHHGSTRPSPPPLTRSPAAQPPSLSIQPHRIRRVVAVEVAPPWRRS